MYDEALKTYLAQYVHPDIVRKEISKIRSKYSGLSVSQERFDFSNGLSRNLVKLSGTIPVPFKAKSYNIPIAIWLMDTHPQHPPVCEVKPTDEMSLKPSVHLDTVGRVYLPYLHDWNENSNLLDLIKNMISAFTMFPPVFAKPRGEISQHAASPYPRQAYGNNMPSIPYPVSGVTPTPAYPPYPAVSQSGHPSNPLPYPTNYSPYPAPATPYPYPPAIQPTYPNQPNIQNSQNIQSSIRSSQNSGTITDEHIRASLMSAIEDKIRRKINEQSAACHDEIEILLQSQRELTQSKNKLDAMFDSMEKERNEVLENIQTLKERESELEKAIEKASNEDVIDLEDSIIASTPLYKQIVNNHCEDAAIEDTIYYIGEGLRQGVIDLEVFVKQIRTLSRRRLILRATIEKCRLKAGLAP